MNLNHLLIFILLLSMTLSSCGERNSVNYLGGWEEGNLSFLPFIKHTAEPDDYYSYLLSYKYSGNIYNEEEQQAISWLKRSRNLVLIFNTVKTVGLDHIISKEKYFKKIDIIGEWEGKTLNEIVSGFLSSDTTSMGNEKYYNEFWRRRKIEGNKSDVFNILREIDEYYNRDLYTESKPINDTLKTLIKLNNRFLTSADQSWEESTYDYFDYLKEIGLEHSAYELAWYCQSYTPDNKIVIKSDSLIATLQLDTISEEEWYRTKYNNAGWIDYLSTYEGP